MRKTNPGATQQMINQNNQAAVTPQQAGRYVDPEEAAEAREEARELEFGGLTKENPSSSSDTNNKGTDVWSIIIYVMVGVIGVIFGAYCYTKCGRKKNYT
eukprot:UN04937